MNRRPTRATEDGRAYLDLQNLARRTARSTEELLRLYALEGFLARLATSSHASNFVLKGGMLLAAYQLRRATRDIDLQAHGISNDVEAILGVVREVATHHLDDGISYHAESATAESIREDDAYQGVRVSLVAVLATARISLHVDVNVGDPVWPSPSRIVVPGLLGRDIELPGYPISMVHAEKLVTAIDRGVASTRWRDFADVYALSGQHQVEARELRGSIERVAEFRSVAIVPLSKVLDGWAAKSQQQWAVWFRKQRLTSDMPARFDVVVGAVTSFADPILAGEVNEGVWSPSVRSWTPLQRTGD